VPADRDWLEVIVPVGAADIDDVAALIASEVPAAAAGTEQRGDEVVFWVPVADGPAALAETRDAVARWQAGGAAVDPAKVRTATAMAEAEWRDAWKRYFKITRLTRQFVVVPSWETHSHRPHDVVIDLDPGMAFGTGTHASTRLVLEEIQALADAGIGASLVLDVGCGSGILSIGAVKLWPGATCVAIDTDPLAIDATLDNAINNRVADRVEASATPLSAIHQEFRLVLANIQAHVLRALRADLVRVTAPGGTLILSGLLTPQAKPLAEEFVAAGMRKSRVRASTDDAAWSVVTLTR
jgi:ribosomal protein L11 methyltransferase